MKKLLFLFLISATAIDASVTTAVDSQTRTDADAQDFEIYWAVLFRLPTTLPKQGPLLLKEDSFPENISLSEFAQLHQAETEGLRKALGAELKRINQLIRLVEEDDKDKVLDSALSKELQDYKEKAGIGSNNQMNPEQQTALIAYLQHQQTKLRKQLKQRTENQQYLQATLDDLSFDGIP